MSSPPEAKRARVDGDSAVVVDPAPASAGAAPADAAVPAAAERVAQCVDGRCRKAVDAHVKATALLLFDAYSAVDRLLRQRLQKRKIKAAYKVLEQLWIEAMQHEDAASLACPLDVLTTCPECETCEAGWRRQQLDGRDWALVMGVYEEFAADAADRVATLQRKLEDPARYEEVLRVRDDMSAAEVAAADGLVWQEVRDSYDAQRRASYLDGFDKGAERGVLQWVLRDKTGETPDRVLLTKPLLNATLARLGAECPQQLAVHSLVYGSMFVTGQAMGLSQRFHDAVLAEAWAGGKRETLALEMYSHLVNRRSAPHPFLTMIPAADGSLGRVQDLSLSGFVDALVSSKLPGVLYCNPPYVEGVMDRDLPAVVAALKDAAERGADLTVLSLLPDWMDNVGVRAIATSPQLRSHWHLKKHEHMVCLENGTEVPMGVGQRLSLLSTVDNKLSPAIWRHIAVKPETTPVVPEHCDIAPESLRV